MNKLCECPAAGWCARHQKKKGPEQFKRCQGSTGDTARDLKYWNAWERGQAGATAPADPQIDPDGFGFEPAADEMTVSTIGSQLHEIIKRETGVEIPCPDCLAAILLLDSKTQDDVRGMRQALIADIHSRALKQAPELWQKIAIFTDGILHTGQVEARIGRWVDEAIETGAEPKKKEAPKLPQRTIDLRNRIVASEASRKLMRNRAGRSSRTRPPVSRRVMSEIVPRPFTGPPKLTLLCHCWPKGENWRKHIEYLAPVANVFDRKIMGVATGEGTASFDQVREAFGDSWEYFAVRNDKALREVLTYRKMLAMVQSVDENEVTFCIHTKGTQDHTAGSEQVRWWTEAMYSTVIYNWQNVLATMAEGYPIAGSFVRHGPDLNTRHEWHFSGTFYAIRNADVFANGIPEFDGWWFGTESWPGHHFARHEAACMFADNCGDIYKVNPTLEQALNEGKQQHGLVDRPKD